MIKIISYVSKANKTQKIMIDLSQKLMKNIKFNLETNKSNIKFEKYFFSGIPIPKNVEIKDINHSGFNVAWSIDKLNIIDINNNEIEYVLELKSENQNFKKVYEGSNNSYLVDNLVENENYQFRICSVYHNVNGTWSEIQKVKTTVIDCDSLILKDDKRKKEFIKILLDWTGGKKMELLFRGTRDGMNHKEFYNKCDNQGPTIILIQNETGNIFGGYASVSWVKSKEDKYYSAPDSFLFTLTNIFNIQPTKFPSKNNNKEIRCYPSDGPRFGNGTDLGLNSDYSNQGGWTNLGTAYPDILGKGRSIFTGDINTSNQYFKIREIEVFKLVK